MPLTHSTMSKRALLPGGPKLTSSETTKRVVGRVVEVDDLDRHVPVGADVLVVVKPAQPVGEVPVGLHQAVVQPQPASSPAAGAATHRPAPDRRRSPGSAGIRRPPGPTRRTAAPAPDPTARRGRASSPASTSAATSGVCTDKISPSPTIESARQQLVVGLGDLVLTGEERVEQVASQRSRRLWTCALSTCGAIARRAQRYRHRSPASGIVNRLARYRDLELIARLLADVAHVRPPS